MLCSLTISGTAGGGSKRLGQAAFGGAVNLNRLSHDPRRVPTHPKGKAP